MKRLIVIALSLGMITTAVLAQVGQTPMLPPMNITPPPAAGGASNAFVLFFP